MVVLILAGVVYSLILRPEPNIILSSSIYHSVDTYQEATKEALKTLENRNKLTFDADQLNQALQQQFPEISSVRADLPFIGQTPAINIEVAPPAFILAGAKGTYGAGKRTIVDSKGKVIGLQPQFPTIKDLPLITDEAGFDPRSGQTVLSQSEINFILAVITQLEKAKIPIDSLTLPKVAQQLDLRTTDRKYYVKFYLGGDALVQSGQFLAARENFDSTKKQPKQYLDVRVAGKIFYK